ncbi:MAG: hypothetical protein K0Q72_1533 [Armatimonadetes bacterium]|jgi:DNA-binding beta-propeller fold protein YncE|nr:hypothetical protein [Armatimonadota bacterium]
MFRPLFLLLALLFTAPFTALYGSPDEPPYEVWLMDQSDTRPDGGGTLHIYPGPAVTGGNAANVAAESYDFGAAARDLALSKGQVTPRRPHMVFFNASGSHAVVAFVVTGHVLFLDTQTRTPVEIIDVGAQAHAAVPAPNEQFVVVANQNGKLLQRISTNYATNTFTLDAAATLDLASGVTPNGLPVQDPVLRPDNAPICIGISADSRLGFVTLRGGGLFVVDCTTTPMRIVAEYDRSVIEPSGCGPALLGGKMYIDSGSAGPAHARGHDVYAFNVDAISLAGNAPNMPPAKLVYRRVGSPAPGDVDAHGTMLTKHGRYLWVADRIQNDVTVVDTATDAVVNAFSLAGKVSGDPAPDLLALSPSGNRAFATLRGPFPGSGGHAAFGSTPGLGVIHVQRGGLAGGLAAVAPVANLDAAGQNRADPHGIAVLVR